jgi:hypothetical protein
MDARWLLDRQDGKQRVYCLLCQRGALCIMGLEGHGAYGERGGAELADHGALFLVHIESILVCEKTERSVQAYHRTSRLIDLGIRCTGQE